MDVLADECFNTRMLDVLSHACFVRGTFRGCDTFGPKPKWSPDIWSPTIGPLLIGPSGQMVANQFSPHGQMVPKNSVPNQFGPPGQMVL